MMKTEGIRVKDVFRVFLVLALRVGCVDAFLLENGDVGHACPHSIRHEQHVKVYGKYCYWFHLDTEVYWDDARRACQSKRGDLVVVNSSDIQHFIMSSLKGVGFKHNGVWIGLTDAGHETHWRWVTGEPLAYSHWGPGGGAGFLHEAWDCVYLRYSQGGQWLDNACRFLPIQYSYICQIERIHHTTTSTTTSTPPTTTVACMDYNCQHRCAHGYSDVYVGADGCINCICNS